MIDIIGVIIFIIGLSLCLIMDFIVWRKPKKYMQYIHKRKNRVKSLFPFLPDWLINFGFFYECKSRSKAHSKTGVRRTL